MVLKNITLFWSFNQTKIFFTALLLFYLLFNINFFEPTNHIKILQQFNNEKLLQF